MTLLSIFSSLSLSLSFVFSLVLSPCDVVCDVLCRHSFCSLSHEKTQSGTLAFHDVCFSKPLTFHNDFMLFAPRISFKHFFRFQGLFI